MQIRLDAGGWVSIFLALGITAIAHIGFGLMWGQILSLFNVKISLLNAAKIYVKTNLTKYLPGNVWHFYGRMNAVVESGSAWGVASLSVLLEPLLLAAAASIIAAIGVGIQMAAVTANPGFKVLIPLALVAVLVGIHPRFFNPVIQKVSKGKTADQQPIQLRLYPWQPLLGEMGCLLLRGISFLLIWQAIAPLDMNQIPQLLGIYSAAWLAGFLVPGAPGGIGVFESVAIILLETIGQTEVTQGNLLIIVAILRLVNTLGEILPLGLLGWRNQSINQSKE